MFGVITVMFGIFNEVNNPPWNHSQSHPVLEFFLFWSMLSWIAMLEGCQISVVGLQGFDPESFRDTHPRAYKCCKLVHVGPNVERFLVGRQFLLLFNGFLVSRIGGGQAIEHFEMGSWEWTHHFTHSSYLLKDVLCWISGIDLNTADPEKALNKDWFHWARCGLSVFAVCFSATFVIKGIALSQTNATE